MPQTVLGQKLMISVKTQAHSLYLILYWSCAFPFLLSFDYVLLLQRIPSPLLSVPLSSLGLRLNFSEV